MRKNKSSVIKMCCDLFSSKWCKYPTPKNKPKIHKNQQRFLEVSAYLLKLRTSTSISSCEF